MSIGLVALLDDVAAIAKAAAASLDDVAAQAAKAGSKAVGVVVDDAAVTPRYVAGLAPARELPMIWRITLGSLRNKLLVLLPAALALAEFAPWAITPLLMLGGLYLCYEGAEKIFESLAPHAAAVEAAAPAAADPRAFEDEKVAGAIRTDFILSAEIMAISLAAIPEGSLLSRAAALSAVAVFITLGVYGVVAAIVKIDDVGLALSRRRGAATAAFGRWLVRATAPLLAALAVVGTAAMLWVGGQIVLHGLESFALAQPAHLAQAGAARAAALAPPAVRGAVEWLAGAVLWGVFGLAVGFVLIPIAGLAGRLFRSS